MIGLVTDSNSQLPDEVAERFGIEVVALTVTIDGVAYAEGTELSADAFYERFESGRPEVTTSQPSPGAFAEAYARLASAGAEAILSIHIGSAVSGTLNSARLAATGSPVRVRLVDTGTASFGVAFCVRAAAEALKAGSSIEEAATIAEQLAPSIGNVFVVGGLDLVRAGGRLAAGVAEVDTATSVPVLSLVEGEIVVVGNAIDLDDAATIMVGRILEAGTDLRVAVGAADTATQALGDALAKSLSTHQDVRDLVRYRIGPSVGVHTGPGSVGAFFYSSDNASTIISNR